MAGKRLIDANGIVMVAERAYDAWNLAMAAADGKREINLVYKRQELCKAVTAVSMLRMQRTARSIEFIQNFLVYGTVPSRNPKRANMAGMPTRGSW